MSDEAQPFTPYDLPGIGTVIAHDNGSYCVLEADGQVHGYPAPGGICSADTAAADIAATRAALWVAPDAVVFADHLAAGYLDATTGIKLKTTERAQRIFADGLTLIREALDAGQLTAASPFTFFDYDNAEHSLSVADFRALMLRYGLFCQQLFTTYAP